MHLARQFIRHFLSVLKKSLWQQDQQAGHRCVTLIFMALAAILETCPVVGQKSVSPFNFQFSSPDISLRYRATHRRPKCHRLRENVNHLPRNSSSELNPDPTPPTLSTFMCHLPCTRIWKLMRLMSWPTEHSIRSCRSPLSFSDLVIFDNLKTTMKYCWK